MAVDFDALVPFGAAVHADLSQLPDEIDLEIIRALLREHKLLVFGGQCLAAEDQIRAMGYLGVVLPPEKEHRELALDGDFGRSKIAYHSDLLFTEEPYQRLSLYAMEVDHCVSSTRFVSGCRAAESLPKRLLSRIEKMDAISVVPVVQTHRELCHEPTPGLTSHRHPVLAVHPTTGEKVLTVTEMQTCQICNLTPNESEDLLNELFGYLYADDGVLEHFWREGDFVVWDNLALQHARDEQVGVKVRRMRRVVGANRSFYDLCPEFSKGDPDIEKWGEGNKLSLS